jgi:hypothetical protein
MGKRKRHAKVLLFLAGFCLLWPLSAQAYLDPGTGSSLLQLILAVLFTVLFCVKLAWARIKTWTGQVIPGRKNEKQDDDR